MPYHNDIEDCYVGKHGSKICPDCKDHPIDWDSENLDWPEWNSERSNCKNLIHYPDGTQGQCGCWSKVHELGYTAQYFDSLLTKVTTEFVWLKHGLGKSVKAKHWPVIRKLILNTTERLLWDLEKHLVGELNDDETR